MCGCWRAGGFLQKRDENAAVDLGFSLERAGLKDQTARIDAVIWKGGFAKLKTKLQEGLEVVTTGKVTTYPSKSTYQIIVEALEPAGVGALMALVEERRRKLAAEGLFA